MHKKIRVWLCSASHVVILPYKFDFKIKDVDYGTDDITVSDIFNEVVGKTIKSYEIHKTDKLDEIRHSLAWEDAGFDEKQEEFITGLDFIFTDESRLCFRNDIDFMKCFYEAQNKGSLIKRAFNLPKKQENVVKLLMI